MAWGINGGKQAFEAAKEAETMAYAAENAAQEADLAKKLTEAATLKAITETDYIKGKRPLIEQSIVDAATSKTQSENTTVVAAEAKTTAETIKSQFNQIVADKGGNNPEVVQARGSAVNLNARLDGFNTQLADTAKKSDVDAKVSQIVSGTPKGTYTTLSALQLAFPTGATGIYVVVADGNWYYWNASAWASGGVYQSSGLPDTLTFKATNLMKSGDFSQGLTGWAAQGGTASVASNTYSLVGNGTLGKIGTYNAVGYRYLGKEGHKIYMRARVMTSSTNASGLLIYATDGTKQANLDDREFSIANPKQDIWYDISGIIIQPSEFEGKDIRHFILASYSSPAEALGKTVQIFRPLAIDLTEVFGAGNEPSSVEVDAMLSKFNHNWFNGSEDLLTLKQYIQDLKSKIVTSQPSGKLSTPYELYDDFSDSLWAPEHTATTSTALDRRKSLSGSGSLKITVSNSAMTSRAVDKQNVNVLLGKKNQMMIKIWVDEPSKISEMNLYLGNEENTWSNYCRMPVKGNGEGNASQTGGMLRKGWNFIAVIPSEMLYTNNFNWDMPVRRSRITLTPTTNDPTSITLDSIWVNGKGSPKLIITFDDAWKTVYDNAYPAMKQRGIVGTTYVIGQYTDNPSNPISPWFCSLDELKGLQKDGWSLANHTWQHNYYFGGGHTPTSYLATIDQNRDWMLNNGIGTDSLHFCYPNGEYDMGVVALLEAKGYKTARAAKSRGAHPILVDDRYQIFSRNFHNGVTLEQAKKWVDIWIESGGTTFFQLHQIPLDDTTKEGQENPSISWSKGKFVALMDYIVEKGMAGNCMGQGEWYENFVKNQT